MSWRKVIATERYRLPVRMGMFWTFVSTFASALVLDDGKNVFRLCLVALVVFWSMAVIIILRRPHNPTRIDLWLIEWGFPPFAFVFIELTHYVWHWRGLW